MAAYLLKLEVEIISTGRDRLPLWGRGVLASAHRWEDQ